MNNKARIIAAFAVGATAGALLGVLLHASGNSQNKKIGYEDEKKRASFFHKLFRSKENPAGNLGDAAKLSPAEYEEA